MFRYFKNPRLAVFVLLVLFACTALPAFSAEGEARRDMELSAERITSARQSAESDANLAEDIRPKVLELYDQASKWLHQTAAVQGDVQRLKTQVRDAPARIDAIRAELAAPPPVDSEPPPVTATLNEVELALSQANLELNHLRDRLKDKEHELSGLLVGAKSLGEDIADRSASLERIDQDLASRPEETPALSQARTLALESRKKLRQTEIELFKLRLGSLNLLTNLAQAERDQLASQLNARQPRLSALQERAKNLRERQARDAREEAEAAKADAVKLPPALQNAAADNARFRSELEDVIHRENEVAGRMGKTRLQLDGIKADFERTRRQVEVVGSSEAIGKMLRKRLEQLPSVKKYRRTARQLAQEISRAMDRQITIGELQRELDVNSAPTTPAIDIAATEQLHLERSAKTLSLARRDALNELQKVYSRYIGQLTTLDLAEHQLLEVARSYVDYIEDQLIWIPSAKIGALSDAGALRGAVLWLLSPAPWGELTPDIVTLLEQRPGTLLAVIAGFLLLLAQRSRAKRRLLSIAEATRKIRTDSFRHTLRALGWTLVLASPGPLLVIAVARLLDLVPGAALVTQAVSDALMAVGAIWLSINFIRHICRPNGLGERHLRWQQPIRQALLREFTWLLPVSLILGFFVFGTAGAELPQGVQTLGRAAFILLMLVATLFTYRLLRRDGELMQAVQRTHADALAYQLHVFWFPPLLLLGPAVGMASALGYHYTAMQLEQRVELTFWFFFGLFMLKELLLRYLYIAERRLRYEDALRRRDELRAQRAREESGEEEEEPLLSVDIPEVDFEQLGEQAKSLVKGGFLLGAVIGIWSIWSELLPTLGFANAIDLPFNASRVVDGVATEVPVTLSDLSLGLLILLITSLAAKNLPGLLEMTLLQRLPMDSGARYAFTSLSQYSIVGIGVITAFTTIGFQWSSIQWLVAALGVGLGFGLQEIVANFVSGIILLFERPIRVGDVVTVDDTTGVVSRIRIRATTIINYDKQELLVPNKEFITGRLINWTLSDKVNRVIINVGVAYGSDVQQAMKLMLEAAEENENVLADPKPVATFEGFGDSSLTLLLRSYLGSMDHRLGTITELHQAINDKFSAAGIAIPFPQREVRLLEDG